MTSRQMRRSVIRHSLAILGCLFALYPIIWIVSSAFNAVDSLGASRLIPRDLTTENFVDAFSNPVAPVGRWLWNSFYIALSAGLANVAVAALSAYAFSRLKFFGRRALLTSLLAMQIFPQFLGFVAFFIMARQFGDVWSGVGLNTHLFLILV